MPTPSDNTPHLSTNPVEEISAHHPSCPPETDRVSTWRASSEESIVLNADDGAVPPATTTPAQSTLNSSTLREVDDNSAPVLEIETSPRSTAGKLAHPDHDVAMESISPVSVSTDAKEERQLVSTMQSAVVPTTPSTPSSLDYEFSNVRVSTVRSRYCEDIY